MSTSIRKSREFLTSNAPFSEPFKLPSFFWDGVEEWDYETITLCMCVCPSFFQIINNLTVFQKENLCNYRSRPTDLQLQIIPGLFPKRVCVTTDHSWMIYKSIHVPPEIIPEWFKKQLVPLLIIPDWFTKTARATTYHCWLIYKNSLYHYRSFLTDFQKQLVPLQITPTP
jgi:hypothetical protein